MQQQQQRLVVHLLQARPEHEKTSIRTESRPAEGSQPRAVLGVEKGSGVGHRHQRQIVNALHRRAGPDCTPAAPVVEATPPAAVSNNAVNAVILAAPATIAVGVTASVVPLLSLSVKPVAATVVRPAKTEPVTIEIVSDVEVMSVIFSILAAVVLAPA